MEGVSDTQHCLLKAYTSLCPDKRIVFFWNIVYTYKPKEIIMALKSIYEYDPTFVDKIEEKLNLQFRKILALGKINNLHVDNNATSGEIYLLKHI